MRFRETHHAILAIGRIHACAKPETLFDFVSFTKSLG